MSSNRLTDKDFPRVVKPESISDKILVEECPLTGGKKVFAKNCVGCKFYDGFLQLGVSSNFSKVHRVLCSHAIPRMLGEMA